MTANAVWKSTPDWIKAVTAIILVLGGGGGALAKYAYRPAPSASDISSIVADKLSPIGKQLDEVAEDAQANRELITSLQSEFRIEVIQTDNAEEDLDELKRDVRVLTDDFREHENNQFNRNDFDLGVRPFLGMVERLTITVEEILKEQKDRASRLADLQSDVRSLQQRVANVERQTQ
ncbi:MAG: hypothetical protein AAF108_02870 [Planctomycetota bacterium]